MAGRPRRRALRGLTRRSRGLYRRKARPGRGRRKCRTTGYSITGHKVPKRLRRRHKRALPSMMRGGQFLPSRSRTRSRRYALATKCTRRGKLRSYWDRQPRYKRRRRGR